MVCGHFKKTLSLKPLKITPNDVPAIQPPKILVDPPIKTPQFIKPKSNGRGLQKLQPIINRLTG